MAMILQTSRLRLTQAIYFGEPPGTGGVISVAGGNGITAVPNPIIGAGNVQLGPLTSTWAAGNFDIFSKNSQTLFNVAAYGATLNGIADDVIPFSNALTDAAAVCGTVYIPATLGGMRLASGVTIPRGVSVIGSSGALGTVPSKIICDHAGVGLTYTAVGPTNYMSRLCDLVIVKGATVPVTLIAINNGWFIYVERCWITGASGQLIKLTGATAHVHFDKNDFSDAPTALRLGSAGAGDFSDGIVTEGNEITGCTVAAVVVNSVNAIYTSRNDVIEGNTGVGIRVDPTGTNFASVIVNIEDAFCEANTTYDVDINPSATALGVGAVLDVNVRGGQFAGTGVGLAAIRMNQQCTSLSVEDIYSLTHVTAGVVLGAAPLALATVKISESNRFDDATKISATDPAISGGNFSGGPAQTIVLDAGTTAGPDVLKIASRGVAGPRLLLDNRDPVSHNSAIGFSQSGATKWRLSSDNAGVGLNSFYLVDDTNAKFPLTVVGNASGGFIGLGDTTSPTRTLDFAGTQRWRGIAAPAVSEANSATVYFDSASNKLKASLNGGGYVDVIGSGGVTGSGAANQIAYWDAATNLASTANLVIDPATGYIGVGTPAIFGVDTINDMDVGMDRFYRSGGVEILHAGVTSGNTFVGLGTVPIPLGPSTDVTAVGRDVLTTNTGAQNTAVGSHALTGNGAGTDNVAVGFNAGATNTTGTNNILIGSGADVAVGNLTNAIAIGYQATVAANDSMSLGDSSMKVGIHTTTPKTGLDVDAAISTRHKNLSLAGGLNSDCPLPDSSWVRIIDPAAPFSVGGFTNGVDGRMLTIYNTTASQMSVDNEDMASTDVNRILTHTGLSINCVVASFIYEDVADRWILVNYV